jgi:hypothetical protein
MTKQVLSVTKSQKKMGRPRTAPTAVVRLPVSVLEAADAWAKTQEIPPTRPEAIRQILTDYLKRRGFLK